MRCITFFNQNFCLTVPKKFVVQPFYVSKNFWYQKILWRGEEGAVSRFFLIVFVSQNLKFS